MSKVSFCQTPVSILELALIALDQPESGWTEVDGPKEEIAGCVVDILSKRVQMLEDYFSLTIDGEGNLCTLPYLLGKISVSFKHLFYPNYNYYIAFELSS